ncbi:TPA: hypothetical protein N0F65_006347 [Lagenidium giganteum]|uniref:Uncharacterized protein n=1 Tax=Lagenidium giganteum TaxID=4803 RepID=A0AAV2YIR3_9STRA|nr:TPA: hypothetical protein N0F65_006347 [Lagenidium giganteum]
MVFAALEAADMDDKQDDRVPAPAIAASHSGSEAPAMDDTAGAVSSPAADKSEPHNTSDPGVSSAKPGATSSSAGGGSSTSRKRIFTFQKRWLHSLPIMEKRLTDAELSTKRGALDCLGDLNGSRQALGINHDPRDVVVCMLCDDPTGGGRDMTKMWSRLNCRRGRIENHLMSKHPEFMLLLKHKRETEDDIAVQLFLQSMREGRCNIRHEISMGLYQMQHHSAATAAAAGVLTAASQSSDASMATSMAADAHLHAASPAMANVAAMNGVKRGFAATQSVGLGDEHDLNGKSTPSSTPTGSFNQPLMQVQDHVQALQDLENRRKKARSASDVLSVGTDASYQDQGSQWQAVLLNKMVVITGGDHPLATSLANHLWMVGASVVVTFQNVTTMDEFTASYVARLPDAESADSLNRGMMLPMLCTLQTRKAIDDWATNVSTKLPHVDFLINFVSNAKDGTIASNDKPALSGDAPTPSGPTENDGDLDESANTSQSDSTLLSSAALLLELSTSITKMFFSSGGGGAVINVVPEGDDARTRIICAGIESMTQSLAVDLRISGVRVNSIFLEVEKAECAEEQRRAPTNPTEDQVNEMSEADGLIDEDKTAVVLLTKELTQLDDPLLEVQRAIHTLQEEGDWFEQYEAVVTIRRAVVHNKDILIDAQLPVYVAAVDLACDNLRSVVSKNAMLSVAECFEFVGRARMAPILAEGKLVDVLLRRSACEKRFLRDAALEAIDKMIGFSSCLELVDSAAAYAHNKNGKVCAQAARIVAGCLKRLREKNELRGEDFHSTRAAALILSLVGFRDGKDLVSRVESSNAFSVIGAVAGRTRLEEWLLAAADSHVTTKILQEVFAGAARRPSSTLGQGQRKLSLKERMMQEANAQQDSAARGQ